MVERERAHLNLLSVAFPLANTFTLAAWGDSCITNEILVNFYNSFPFEFYRGYKQSHALFFFNIDEMFRTLDNKRAFQLNIPKLFNSIAFLPYQSLCHRINFITYWDNSLKKNQTKVTHNIIKCAQRKKYISSKENSPFIYNYIKSSKYSKTLPRVRSQVYLWAFGSTIS
jgi:hypothetical protein